MYDRYQNFKNILVLFVINDNYIWEFKTLKHRKCFRNLNTWSIGLRITVISESCKKNLQQYKDCIGIMSEITLHLLGCVILTSYLHNVRISENNSHYCRINHQSLPSNHQTCISRYKSQWQLRTVVILTHTERQSSNIVFLFNTG